MGLFYSHFLLGLFTCLLFLSLYAGFLLFGGLFTGLLSLFKGFSVGPLLWPLLGFYWPPFVPFFWPPGPFTGLLLSLFYRLSLEPFLWPSWAFLLAFFRVLAFLSFKLCRSLFVVLLLRLFTGLLSFYWPPSEHLLYRAFFFLFTGILFFLPSILYALHFLQSPFTSWFFLSLFSGLLLLLLSILTGRLSPSCGRLR